MTFVTMRRYAYSQFAGNAAARDAKMAALAGKNAIVAPVVAPGQVSSSKERQPLTAAEYGASFMPRIEGLPHTVPRYDALTAPSEVPKPVACLEGIRPGSKVKSCTCWSQQATLLNVPFALCTQIAKGGFFDDSPKARVESSFAAAPADTGKPAKVASAVVPSVDPGLEVEGTVHRDADVLAVLLLHQVRRSRRSQGGYA